MQTLEFILVCNRPIWLVLFMNSQLYCYHNPENLVFVNNSPNVVTRSCSNRYN